MLARILKIGGIGMVLVLFTGCLSSPTRVNPKPPQIHGNPNLDMEKEKKELKALRINEMEDFNNEIKEIIKREGSIKEVKQSEDTIDNLLNSLTD
jgi:hypothetical protein